MFLARGHRIPVWCGICTSLTFCLILAAGQETNGEAEEAPPEPVAQPIAFSHRLHAQKVKLQCGVCHQQAEKSTSAGLPAVSDCMMCHAAIGTRLPEIQKLAQYAGRQEPIKWARVYRVPYWVIFSHQKHHEAGVECSACHGSVSEREVLWREKDLSMDTCVECHTVRAASTECDLCHEVDIWLQ